MSKFVMQAMTDMLSRTLRKLTPPSLPVRVYMRDNAFKNMVVIQKSSWTVYTELICSAESVSRQWSHQTSWSWILGLGWLKGPIFVPAKRYICYNSPREYAREFPNVAIVYQSLFALQYYCKVTFKTSRTGSNFFECSEYFCNQTFWVKHILPWHSFTRSLVKVVENLTFHEIARNFTNIFWFFYFPIIILQVESRFLNMDRRANSWSVLDVTLSRPCINITF